MDETEKIISDLQMAKFILCHPHMINPEMCVRIGQAITSAVTLLKEQGWNALTEDADSVIHGLPGDDGQYLMTDGKDIWIDIYVDGVSDGIILDSGRDVREIKAWMELPDLPKGDER